MHQSNKRWWSGNSHRSRHKRREFDYRRVKYFYHNQFPSGHLAPGLLPVRSVQTAFSRHALLLPQRQILLWSSFCRPIIPEMCRLWRGTVTHKWFYHFTIRFFIQLIFANEYTYAEEKSWHFDHFACFKVEFWVTVAVEGLRYYSVTSNWAVTATWPRTISRTVWTVTQNILQRYGNVNDKGVEKGDERI